MEVDSDACIQIEGADALGAVYGVYEVSQRFLGVDPLWFWKDLEPEPLPDLQLNPMRMQSESPRFRYRGWFINDEDLLAQWREPAGERFRHWSAHPGKWNSTPGAPPPTYEERLVEYYTPVTALETMEAIFEALLRMRGNFIIPASFIDVMEPCETAIIRAAVRRGLYVSQHHVEPLGVSHFAFETWWAAQGKQPSFSYRESAEEMRKCWRAYATAWADLAGDQLVWQLGLRGRGDHPLWAHDPQAKNMAGRLISEALKDQMEIIREVDSRPVAPATLTLWFEGAQLIAEEQLQVPKGVTLVFADDPSTQHLQEDFETIPRQSDCSYGLYFHTAVWTMGPHLVQGPMLGKITNAVMKVAQKGDTEIAVLNVANLREHVLGVACWHHQLRNPERSKEVAFPPNALPEDWIPFYKQFFDAVPELRPHCYLYDGAARTYLNVHLYALELGLAIPEYLRVAIEDDVVQTRRKLTKAIKVFNDLIAQTDAYQPPPNLQKFFDANFRAQLRLLCGLYGAFLGMLSSPPDYDRALSSLEMCKEGKTLATKGKWGEWYRGDCKVGVNRLMARIQRLSESTV